MTKRKWKDPRFTKEKLESCIRRHCVSMSGIAFIDEYFTRFEPSGRPIKDQYGNEFITIVVYFVDIPLIRRMFTSSVRWYFDSDVIGKQSSRSFCYTYGQLVSYFIKLYDLNKC